MYQVNHYCVSTQDGSGLSQVVVTCIVHSAIVQYVATGGHVHLYDCYVMQASVKF